MSPPLVLALHGHGDHPRHLREALAPALPPGWDIHAPTGTHGSPSAPSWFDADDHSTPLNDQIVAATTTLAALVDDLAAERPLVLVGYSQGASLAATWLLSHRRPPGVAGVALLAGFLPPVDADRLDLSNAAAMPVLIVHGTDDEAVPLPLGRSVARLLDRNEAQLDWHEIDGGHEVSTTMIDTVGEWLRSFTS